MQVLVIGGIVVYELALHEGGVVVREEGNAGAGEGRRVDGVGLLAAVEDTGVEGRGGQGVGELRRIDARRQGLLLALLSRRVVCKAIFSRLLRKTTFCIRAGANASLAVIFRGLENV